ncbi:MAG: hypothetical protein H6708_17490 [Kofleriaceae bacterium]|nr:hypothetical protein [Myxococcales bacterium]MCB9562201.1 hypothetical protein [Kofleriaceae bacterium]
MHDSATVEAALAAIRKGSFHSPAEPDVGRVEASFDAEVVRQDETKLVLEVHVYVTCDEDDQEYASILAREEWWSQISSALYEQLGVVVEVDAFRLYW